MSDTKDTSKHGMGARTLSVKRSTVEQGRVRQNFSHGRSKTVAVEIKRKRSAGPGEPVKIEPREAQPLNLKPQVARPEPKREEPVSPTRSGMVLRTLTDDEKEARERALADARLREAEERKHVEEEAKRRSHHEEVE